MNLEHVQGLKNYISTVKAGRRSGVFLSLRLKILLGFTITLTFLFAGAFYWFYAFMTEKMVDRLRTDMRSTLLGTAREVDVNELLALYREGEPNADGFSDDPRYWRQLNWLDTMHQAEPEMWFYIFIIDVAKNNRRVGDSAVRPEQLETIYLVDLWAKYDPSKAGKFLQSDVPIARGVGVILQNRLVEHPGIYTDRWGTWLSAAAPLFDDTGNVAAVIGLDVQAEYVFQLQREIRNKVLVAFGATYGLLFVIIYIASELLTRYLSTLSKNAETIAQGSYSQTTSMAIRPRIFPDELDTLAQSFETMVESIRIRESLIRESNRAEHEIQLALQREREMHELKSQFISLVSHEFWTPLTVIRTSAELLERYKHVASEEKKRDYFQRIYAAIRNISNLIDDILTIGQVEAGKFQIRPTQVDLGQFCFELVQEIQTSIDATDRVQFEMLGKCSDVYLDPKLLRSILINLLSNAIKYSSASSAVRFMLSCTGQRAIFEIQDSGIGIPAEDQPQLFELFHRGQNVSSIDGTGLGLAITKQCVDLLQGEILFSSEEHIGTRFIVKLPFQVAHN